MTKLELLPRKAFQLTLSDGTVVEGQFGTWALARFGEKKKISLPEIMELFASGKFTVMDMLSFVICACEYRERENGKPPYINDIRLSRFIDDYSNDHDETGILMKIFLHSGDKEELSRTPDSEKKTNPILGELSSVNSLQPEEV